MTNLDAGGESAHATRILSPMSTRRIQPCRNQDCSSFWPRSCCQFFSSIKFHSTFPQRLALVLILAMLARIVSIASTVPKKAGSVVFVSSFYDCFDIQGAKQ